MPLDQTEKLTNPGARMAGQKQDEVQPATALDRVDVALLLAIAAVWIALVVVVNPIGEFPLDDDWAYVLPVKGLLESGTIRFTDWNAVSLIAQAFWGALFSWPVGFSITALRISTLSLGLVGLFSLYLLLRGIDASRAVAVLGVLTLAGNPIYYNLSYTFMTDVPSLALMVLSVLLLVRGMDLNRDRFIWTGLAVCLLSLFVRQIAIAILLAFVVAYPFKRGIGVRWLLQAIVPMIVGFLALRLYGSYLSSIDQLPRSYYKFHEELGQSLGDLAHLKIGVLKFPLWRSLVLLVDLGLFLSPMLSLLWPRYAGRLSRRSLGVHLLFVCVATALITAWLLATGHAVPIHGTTLKNLSLGLRSLPGEWPPGLPMWFWSIITLVSVFSGTTVLAALTRTAWGLAGGSIDPASRRMCWRLVFLAMICVFYFGPTAFAYHFLFDRYLVGLVPFAMALIVEIMDSRGIPVRPLAPTLSACLASFGLAFGVAATHDYLAWNRVRWTTGRDLLAGHRLELEEIDAGWEFNNYYPNMRRLYFSRAERDKDMTASEREVKSGGSVRRSGAMYRVAVSPLEGYEVLRRYPVARWLPSTPAEIFVLKRNTQVSVREPDHIPQESRNSEQMTR
jgi:hypothetical protein